MLSLRVCALAIAPSHVLCETLATAQNTISGAASEEIRDLLLAPSLTNKIKQNGRIRHQRRKSKTDTAGIRDVLKCVRCERIASVVSTLVTFRSHLNLAATKSLRGRGRARMWRARHMSAVIWNSAALLPVRNSERVFLKLFEHGRVAHLP